MTDEFDKTSPQYYIALNLLGVYYDKMRWFHLAEQCYLKASKHVIVSKYNYASLLITRGKKEMAAEYLNDYIEKYPDDYDGYREMARVYGWKDTEKRNEMWEKAFEKGWSGDFFEMLIYNVSKFTEDVAREKNNVMADVLFIRMTGFDSLKSDEEKEKYIKLISPKICNRLGLIYFSGKHLVKQDYNRACQIWDIAIKMEEHIISPFIKEDIVCAKYNLALSYKKGEGVPKNKEKAIELFMQCQEDPDAQREIAEYFEHAELNKQKAKEWYLKAANNKLPDYESCLHLARVYDDVSVKDKATYFLRGIKRESVVKYNDKNSVPKSYNISTDVMLYYEAKITKLRQKLLELECRPPSLGGRLYLQAKAKFENDIEQLNLGPR